MKNNSNKITLIFVLILMFMAILGHKLFVNYFSKSPSELVLEYSYTKDLLFIIFSGLVLKIIL